ncbi:MAG: DNA-binding response regulator [Chloroflexi bacterium]|nr:MAG: DNA-binding response regulator [Chloroflexota bacterium]PIE82008.1 MAG: DNA-binding response regulator [Chloroflexota bacterium]
MTTYSLIRVLLIDDHRQVHQAISTILATVDDIELVGQGSNGLEGINLCVELKPDLVLMDVVMPVMDGVAATAVIHEQFPNIKILVLSSFQDHESVYAMLRNGAAGYVTKSALTHELVDTIRTTQKGQVVLSPEVAERLWQQDPIPKVERFHLTDRELEVLVLMAGGQTMNQIAQELVISPSTVKFHINNILAKLSVKTRSEALIVAAKNNLV